MSKSIKIKYNTKNKFLVSAKPGELRFGKFTPLINYSPPKGLELRLLQAEANMRKTSEMVKKAPKNRSIQTMLAELKRTKAIKQSASVQRMALLSNYNSLRQMEKKAVTPETALKINQRAELVAKKAEKLEALIKNSTELETRIQKHLTLTLSQEVKAKTKKPKPVVQKVLSEREKEEADNLLDAKSRYDKRKADILRRINEGKLSTTDLINQKMELKETELNLEHINWLLKDLASQSVKKDQKTKAKKN